MKNILDTFCIYHEKIDRNLKIIPKDRNFWLLLDVEMPSSPVALTDVFPEVIGSEEAIQSLISTGTGKFQLSTIFHSSRFIHLLIMPGDEEGSAMVVIRDNTKETQKQQNAIQQRNEVTLLKQTLEEKNRELIKTNKELIALLNQLRAQETDMGYQIESRTQELRQFFYLSMLMQGQTAEFRDRDSGGHVYRVGYVAAMLGRNCGLSPKECETLFFSCLLHDIGKAFVPESILFKVDALSDKEREIMHESVRTGAAFLESHEHPFFSAAAEVVFSHYERWDGTGYPGGLKGESIPLSARICSVAEVFDVLLSKRHYKEAMPLKKAVGTMLMESGRHFDPAIIQVFQGVLDDIVSLHRDVSKDEDGHIPDFYSHDRR